MPTVAYSPGMSTLSYYYASAFDQIHLHPDGRLSFTGTRIYMFLRLASAKLVTIVAFCCIALPTMTQDLDGAACVSARAATSRPPITCSQWQWWRRPVHLTTTASIDHPPH